VNCAADYDDYCSEMTTVSDSSVVVGRGDDT